MRRPDSEQIIVAGSYLQHFEYVIEAAKEFEALGKTTYPPTDATVEKMTAGFVRVNGVDETIEGKIQLEMAFLRRVRHSELIYGISHGGYIGQSTSVELLLALSYNKPVFVCEQIKLFGAGVPENIGDMLIKYHPPVLPINKIHILGDNAFESFNRISIMEKNEKLTAYLAAAHLPKGW